MSDPIPSLWNDIRRRCDGLEPGAELHTPVSDRPFEVEATREDRIDVRFLDSGERRPLWREQFGVLLDRLRDGPVDVDALPPGVEPYASVASLLPDVVADGETLVREPDAEQARESPYLVSAAEARTRPERLHDDAVLLADLLARLEAEEPASLDTPSLADLYVLLSDVQHEADRLRRSVRGPLLDRLGPDQSLHGTFGTVRRTTRTRRQPKDDETVLDALDDRGIPREWVLGVDSEKLDVVLAVTDLAEDAVYDEEEQVYVQKTDVEEAEKYERLRGLADRLDDLDDDEAADIREDLSDLESRLEEALSA